MKIIKITRLAGIKKMLRRFNRYPGGRVLGFGAATHMQRRNVWNSNDMAMAAVVGVGGISIISTLAVYLTIKSYRYFHNNYEIVRKNKNDDKNTDRKEGNVSRHV